MKSVKVPLSLRLVFVLMTCGFSADTAENQDPDLERVMKAVFEQKNPIPFPNYPEKPKRADILVLEQRIGKIPFSLEQFLMAYGNLHFGPFSFRPVHARDIGDGKVTSCLFDFICEGQEKNIPANWIAFCEEGDDYVCMDLLTGKVGYFNLRGRKVGVEYATLSYWISNRLRLK